MLHPKSLDARVRSAAVYTLQTLVTAVPPRHVAEMLDSEPVAEPASKITTYWSWPEFNAPLDFLSAWRIEKSAVPLLPAAEPFRTALRAMSAVVM